MISTGVNQVFGLFYLCLTLLEPCRVTGSRGHEFSVLDPLFAYIYLLFSSKSELTDYSDGDDVWKRAEIDIDLFFGAPFVIIIEVPIKGFEQTDVEL